MYKNRSSRKTDSQLDKRSSRRPILLKIVSENRFSRKTKVWEDLFLYNCLQEKFSQSLEGNVGDLRKLLDQEVGKCRDQVSAQSTEIVGARKSIQGAYSVMS